MRNLREPIYIICKEEFDRIVGLLTLCQQTEDINVANSCAIQSLKYLTEFDIDEEFEE